VPPGIRCESGRGSTGTGCAIDGQRSGEWWKTLELSPDERGRLYFVDETTAERFARFLLDDGAEAVAIEHWRDGRRAAISFVRP
jgi:hypothetical protein